MRINIKKGPPINDIIIPTGISKGEKRVLERVSQRHRKPAPKSAQRGIRAVCVFPAIFLTACGTISPSKEISPARLTAQPARSAESKRNKVLERLTLSPNPVAFSSPKERMSSSFESVKRKMRLIKIMMEAGTIFS